jgi:hypothetical protein
MKGLLSIIISFFLSGSPGILFAQNIGIGTTSPTGPLSFGNVKNDLGQTISLLNKGYGIGTSGNDLIFTLKSENPGSHNILLGHGRSAAFTELMRIQNNQRTGIGVSSPQQALDVNGRIRSKWFGTNTTPGILYSYNNRHNMFIGPYLFGMLNNNVIGLISSGANIFNYDATTGALGLGGSYGTAGQIAMVKANEVATTWASLPSFSDVYNGTLQYVETSPYTLTDVTPTATLSAFNLLLSFSKYTKVQLDFSLTVSTNSCALCGPTYFWVNTFAGGVLVNRSRFMVANGRTTTVTDGVMFWAGMGRNISISVEKISGPALILPVSAGRLSTLVLSSFPID